MTEANITWITDQIATGGDFSFNPEKAMRQFSELLDMDIDLIIDCRIEDNDAEVWADTDVDYLHIPVNDDGNALPASHFDAAVEAARPVLDGGGKVFVHCHMGVNRGPSTAFALLLDQRVPARRAFDMIRDKRPEAAIYYAVDALKAHLARMKTPKKKANERMTVFMMHHAKVFGPKEMRKVQHIIRDNHQRDREEMAAR